uniref:Cytochrome P450 n=1 Tax=Rhabditophanes sp. KR3021 TaxID=114890 RepID=A0AC35TWD5_9BILA
MIVVDLFLAFLVIYILFNISAILKWWKARQRSNELAAQFYGPPGLPVFGNMLNFIGGSVAMANYMSTEVNKAAEAGEDIMKFNVGPFLWIVPLTGKAVEAVVESSEEIKKDDNYDFAAKWFGQGLLTSSGDRWRQRRKLLTPSFNTPVLKGFLVDFNEQTKILLSKFDAVCDGKTEVNVFPYLQKAALDMICATAMGYNLKSQEDPENEYLQATSKFHSLLTHFSVNPQYKVDALYYIFGRGFELDKVLKTLKAFTSKVIETKKREIIEFARNNCSGKIKGSLMSSLLELNAQNKLTDIDVKDEADTFVFGGFNSTSTSHSFLLWSLATHPEVQQKLFEEIFDVYGDDERDVIYDDFSKFTYLDMVIKESLRRHPSVPFGFREIQNEFKVLDKTVPKGAHFMLSTYFRNLNPKLFPEPLKFDPDRFLVENITKNHPYDYTPFSSGPRNCIGQTYAMIQIRLVVISVLRRFKLSARKGMDYVIHVPEVVLTPLDDIPIIFSRRV